MPENFAVELCSIRDDRRPDEISRARVGTTRDGNQNMVIPEEPHHLQAVCIDAVWLAYVTANVTQSSSSTPCGENPSTIYKVPQDLRNSDSDAYQPKVVLIGPYHNVPDKQHQPSFSYMEDRKWQCVRNLVSRHINPSNQNEQVHVPDETRSLLLESCLVAIKASGPPVRSCYSEKITPESDDELAVMMLLDGCFILHLLLRNKDPYLEKLYDSKVVGKLSIWNSVMYDLLLLENQIPFFVIQKLFHLLRTPEDKDVDLAEQALELFSSLHPKRVGAIRISTEISSPTFHHLLHLFYLSITLDQSPQEQPTPQSSQPDWIPSATELQQAGVKFKKSKKDSSFVDIKFSNGILQIPPLEIYDYSGRLLRNLIAFEQCYRDTKCHITIYATFMDCIINTSKDLRVLRLNGILTNRMSADQDPTHFFSQLCSQVHYASDRNYLSSVFKDVNNYHGSKRHQWGAGLARDYFSNPWTTISVGAATFLLLLTFVQTFFAAYSYFRPPN